MASAWPDEGTCMLRTRTPPAFLPVKSQLSALCLSTSPASLEPTNVAVIQDYTDHSDPDGRGSWLDVFYHLLSCELNCLHVNTTLRLVLMFSPCDILSLLFMSTMLLSPGSSTFMSQKPSNVTNSRLVPLRIIKKKIIHFPIES